MSGAKFELLLGKSDIQGAIQAMAASPAEINKAANAASRHTLKKMSTLVARSISAVSGIPTKALRSRISVRKYSSENPVWILFVGLNRMPMDIAETVSQNPVGLKHSRGIVKGGFYKAVHSHAPQGWIRKKRARDLGLRLPGLGEGNPAVRFPGSDMNSRFPVLRISHDLGQHAQTVINQFQGRVRADFLVRFEHELKRIKGFL